ncbi:hypothetical protein C5470_06815 [Photorhabdus stackebrandtii]|uniref:Uncharacterized protein n=1 Tax=Photorhabdus stackebrandtii TaxID=1123042 RepID=A0A7X5QKW2_9GAMM|nr:hypothetical protein [Photorhabdus stackebrandtii]
MNFVHEKFKGMNFETMADDLLSPLKACDTITEKHLRGMNNFNLCVINIVLLWCKIIFIFFISLFIKQ